MDFEDEGVEHDCVEHDGFEQVLMDAYILMTHVHTHTYTCIAIFTHVFTPMSRTHIFPPYTLVPAPRLYCYASQVYTATLQA